MTDVSSKAASQHRVAAVQSQKSPALLEEAAQIQKRVRKPAAETMTDVSSKASLQHTGTAVQPQMSAAVVSSHGGARARRTLYEHLEAMDEHDKAAVSEHRR